MQHEQFRLEVSHGLPYRRAILWVLVLELLHFLCPFADYCDALCMALHSALPHACMLPDTVDSDFANEMLKIDRSSTRIKHGASEFYRANKACAIDRKSNQHHCML